MKDKFVNYYFLSISEAKVTMQMMAGDRVNDCLRIK